jgi:hypothetical protein
VKGVKACNEAVDVELFLKLIVSVLPERHMLEVLVRAEPDMTFPVGVEHSY